MLQSFQRRDVLMRVLLVLVVALIGGAMVITLVPIGMGSFGDRTHVLARVGRQEITTAMVEQQLREIERVQQIPAALRGFYANTVFQQLLYERMLEEEARRLGIRVTEEEHAEFIKSRLPTVFAGDTFLGMDRYTAEVQSRFGMTVAEFEDRVRLGLLETKLRRLVTDGLGVTPEEIEQEFRRRNEKVKIEFVRISPAALESQVSWTNEDLARHFEENRSSYQVPEQRRVRYVLLDREQIRNQVSPTETELRNYYDTHRDQYRVENRVRVRHILFKTFGKTEAEIEEIHKKAEQVLRRARRGEDFTKLAREFSEDTTAQNGGDLGWILRGQTVPEFEQAAFSLPVGSLSDLVRTQYGFHILKIEERETARTKSFEEVRDSIAATLREQQSLRRTEELAEKLAAAVRQSTRRPIEEIAAELGLSVQEAGPIGPGEPVGALGSDANLQNAIFRLRPGELSAPVALERGHVVVTVTEILPAHPGTLEEVRERVIAELRKLRAVSLARARAEELARRAQAGQPLSSAARALGLTAQTTGLFALNDSVEPIGNASQLAAAFRMKTGESSAPLSLGTDWVVFRVLERQPANPQELAAQQETLRNQLLEEKKTLAYEAFRSALEQRLRREGKLEINQEALARLRGPIGS
ncbi:MAG: peptidyl-prolyl cis-trans isomerase [Firmicutes bacterium]|nr:peptidyl-prolyl cis-trans isomerase [Bacillota bacterium]